MEKGKSAYINAIMNAAKNKSPEILRFTSDKHAIELTKALLDNISKKGGKISLILDNMDSTIFSQLSAEFRNALENGAELRLLSTRKEYDPSESTLGRVLGGMKNFSLRRIPNGVDGLASSSSFLVIDSVSFRAETDKGAMASFNHPELAEKLEKIFDKQFEKSEPVK